MLITYIICLKGNTSHIDSPDSFGLNAHPIPGVLMSKSVTFFYGELGLVSKSINYSISYTKYRNEIFRNNNITKEKKEYAAVRKLIKSIRTK